ncbi:MAG: N-acyl-D-amino-acid deacylase [Shewanella sp.]|jgi:N-acyl-D-amino-acid deacylase
MILASISSLIVKSLRICVAEAVVKLCLLLRLMSKIWLEKPWVVTSSDGTDGHPRKYASFPQKYQQYVKQNPLLTLEAFIYQSSTKTAEILGLKNRGQLGVGMFADIIILDTENYRAQADFSHWNRYSTGVDTVLINGQLVIDKLHYTGTLAGEVLR